MPFDDVGDYGFQQHFLKNISEFALYFMKINEMTQVQFS